MTVRCEVTPRLGHDRDAAIHRAQTDLELRRDVPGFDDAPALQQPDGGEQSVDAIRAARLTRRGRIDCAKFRP
jgi:hypothetical protein